jgi:hypothetical protein
MTAAGAGYFPNGVVGILSPTLVEDLVRWILLPSFVAELTLALWLASQGVRGVAITRPVAA